MGREFDGLHERGEPVGHLPFSQRKQAQARPFRSRVADRNDLIDRNAWEHAQSDGLFPIQIIAERTRKVDPVDLGCFERPKFYDSYVKALSETSQRAMKVLDNFCDLIVDTITVCSIGVLIFQIDPIFVLLAVLPFIGTLLLGGKYNDLKY